MNLDPTKISRYAVVFKPCAHITQTWGVNYIANMMYPIIAAIHRLFLV